ncbi:4217_t:CDS:2, partial [Cetraspora pellucida]
VILVRTRVTAADFSSVGSQILASQQLGWPAHRFTKEITIVIGNSGSNKGVCGRLLFCRKPNFGESTIRVTAADFSSVGSQILASQQLDFSSVGSQILASQQLGWPARRFTKELTIVIGWPAQSEAQIYQRVVLSQRRLRQIFFCWKPNYVL